MSLISGLGRGATALAPFPSIPSRSECAGITAMLSRVSWLRQRIDHWLAVTVSDTARDLRDVQRDQAMTNKAESILAAG
jgi:hypothetical protein